MKTPKLSSHVTLEQIKILYNGFRSSNLTCQCDGQKTIVHQGNVRVKMDKTPQYGKGTIPDGFHSCANLMGTTHCVFS